MARAGIACKEGIVSDGRFHNFQPHDSKKKSGWYILHDYKFAVFGDFARGIKQQWHYLSDVEVTRTEKKRIHAAIRRSWLKLEVDNKIKQEKVAEKAEQIFAKLSLTGTSEYLKRKQVEGYNIRYGNGYIAIPLRDAEGKLWSLQFIYDDGRKRFLAGGRKTGCFHLIGDTQRRHIIVAEGYATAASIHKAAFKPIVVAFDAGNLDHVVPSIQKLFPYREITIAADNDCWKEINTGKLKAEAAAKKYSCKMVLPEFNDGSTKPTDFNDLHCLEGLDEVASQLGRVLVPNGIPLNFFMKKDGLYWQTADSELPPLKLCSSLSVSAFSHDEFDANHGLVLEWTSPRTKQKHRWSMPMRLLSGDGTEIRSKLLDEGLLLSPVRKAKDRFLEFLATVEPSNSYLSVKKVGWHEKCYILPDTVFPESSKAVLQNEQASFDTYKLSGTLEDWQNNVARYAQGNSRLLFALSAAFAAPLLYLTQEESGGIHFFGSSSTGKTTALRVAASVWGGGTETGWIQQWRATGNALEAIAENHRDALLVLDEIGQADSKTVGDAIYMLANNQGKGRLKSSSELRRAYEWRLLFLSSGEITLEAKMQEAMKKPMAGMATRFANIPADAGKGLGVFEELHGFESGHALCRHFATATKQYYGTAIRAFLASITSKSAEEVEKTITDCVQEFANHFLPPDCDGQVKRVAGRFGLIAVAGEMAIEARILPLKTSDVFYAAGRCLTDWIAERGGTEPMETEKALNQIKAFFELHASSRFAVIAKDDDAEEIKIANQAGVKRKTAEGLYEYFVYPEIFKNELCNGFSPKLLIPVLIERNFIITDKHGRALKNHWLPSIGSKKVYHFTHKVME